MKISVASRLSSASITAPTAPGRTASRIRRSQPPSRAAGRPPISVYAASALGAAVSASATGAGAGEAVSMARM